MRVFKPVNWLVWKFCWDFKKVISGENWLLRWNCVFFGWDFVPLCELWLKAKAIFYFPNSLYYKTIYCEQNDYIPYIIYTKNFLKIYGPFWWMGFSCLKPSATSRRQFTFYHSVPRYSWYSFYRPRKDERLSRPGWLQGRLSLSSFRGRWNEYQEYLGT